MHFINSHKKRKPFKNGSFAGALKEPIEYLCFGISLKKETFLIFLKNAYIKFSFYFYDFPP